MSVIIDKRFTKWRHPKQQDIYNVDLLNYDKKTFNKDTVYIDEDKILIYDGEINHDPKPGHFCTWNGLIRKNYSNKDGFTISSIYDERFNRDEAALSIISNYVKSYKDGTNIMSKDRSLLLNSGDIFIPILKDTDDPLTTIIKKMIIHKQINLSSYKDSVEVEYTLTNMRSAVNGTTQSMSVPYFLAWCKLMKLEWSFTVYDNGTDDNHPLTKELIINHENWDTFDVSVDLNEVDKSNLFLPWIKKDEDPLKKLIKGAILSKLIDIRDYKNRGNTPHLLNNMRSALKGTTKMTMSYFLAWCEILGLGFEFNVYDPETDLSIGEF